MTIALRQTDQVLDEKGKPVVNGYFYVGEYEQDPVANPLALFSDIGLTVPIANPQRTDDKGRPINDIFVAEVQYSYIVKDKNLVVVEGPKNRLCAGDVFAADLSSSANGKGAGMITYVPGGAGAVATTVQKKLQTIVSVFDFMTGAEITAYQNRTGVGDDLSVAANKARDYLHSIGGGILWYPPGLGMLDYDIRLDTLNTNTFTYPTSGVGPDGKPIIVALAPIKHMGAGMGATTLKLRGFYACGFSSFPPPFVSLAAYSGAAYYNANGVGARWTDAEISHMTIDGNRAVVGDSGALYGANYTGAHPAYQNGSNGASLWAADNFQHLIYGWQGEGLDVHHVEFKNTYYCGSLAVASNRVNVHDNKFTNISDLPNYLGYYAAVENDGCRDVWIERNRMKDVGIFFFANGDPSIGSDGTHDHHIVGNKCDGAKNGGVFYFGWAENVWVEDNELKNMCQVGGDIIQFFSEDTAPHIDRHVEDIHILNNQIEPGAKCDAFIRTSASRATIRDNKIKGGANIDTASLVALRAVKQPSFTYVGRSQIVVKDNTIDYTMAGGRTNPVNPFLIYEGFESEVEGNKLFFNGEHSNVLAYLSSNQNFSHNRLESNATLASMVGLPTTATVLLKNVVCEDNYFKATGAAALDGLVLFLAGSTYGVQNSKFRKNTFENCGTPIRLQAQDNGSLHYYRDNQIDGNVEINCTGTSIIQPLSQNRLVRTQRISAPSAAPPNFGTWERSDIIYKENSTAGDYAGYLRTAAGTENGVALAGITANTTIGTKNVTFNSALGLAPGVYITIAGVAGVKKLVTLSGLNGTIDTNASATVAAGAVAYSPGVWKEFGAILP